MDTSFVIPIGEFIEAKMHNPKKLAYRPGWHTTEKPFAPHIKEKENRRWYKVEISDYYELNRPQFQGGKWFIAQKMKVIEPL